jgi:signal transduction histidine kinase/CheY-like chemotaxis protein
MSAIYPSGNLEVDESSLLALFPFFVIIDGNFRVSRLGNHMKSCIHGARVGAHIAEFIKLRLPLVTSSIDDWKWSSLQNCLSDQVAADCIYSNGLTNVRLAGRLTLFKSESELAKTALTCQPSTDEQPPSSSNSSLRQEAFRGALFLLQPVVPLQKELSLIPNYLLGSAGSDDKSGRDFVDKDNDLLLLLLGKLEQLESRNTEMKRQLDEARKSLEMKSMFVRYVSHEIRTPLNTVAMGLKLMQDCGTLSAINESDDATSLAIAKFGEHVRRGSSSFRMIDASGVSSPAARTPYTQSSRRGMAADIKESCDIAIDIVNDLLLYEKLEGGLLQLEKRKEPALSTIIEAVKTLEIQAKQVGIDLQFTFCSDDFPMEELDTPTVSMDVDRPKICQVLRNIVSNAIKFSPTGSVVSVHVELSEDTSGPATPKEAEVSSSCATVGTTVAVISSSQSPDGQKTVPAETAGKIGKELEKSLSSSSMLQKKRFMKVAVKDSGVGISPENQKKLFNSIVQFDPNRLQAGGGSGLGLYISKGIMDLHGGTIGLFSAGEGHGTTFFIELPVEQGARMEKSSSPEMYYDPKSSFFSATHEVQGGGKPVEESGRISVVPLRRVLRSGKGTAAAERSSTPEHVVSVSLRKYGEERRKSAASVSSLSERDEKSIMRRVPSTLNRVQNIRKEYMKILIVDDSRMNRRMTARYLSGRGFCTRRHPDEVSDGQQALESVMKAGASGEPYAAVLIDCMMPVMDGPTAVKKMREGGYKGLVVGVTGNVNQDEVDHFTSHGADMVMSKPLDLDLLTDVLKQITGAREVTFRTPK